MLLDTLGWNSVFESSFIPFRQQGLDPARVVREDRARFRVLGAFGERGAEVTGRFRHEARVRADYPAVGDWVAVRAPEGSAEATIHGVLPRISAFARKGAGETTEEQVIAANVDVVFVLAGLDEDLNLRRLERYLAVAFTSGASPVIVLNKADLATDLESLRSSVEASAPGVPVVCLSARDRRGLEGLGAWLLPARTVAVVGSSGVGKSTLANALLGEEVQATGEVRADDSRGRHTTTRRELLMLPCGTLFIDTPGMRELGLWSADEGVGSAFPEIDALAARCRFRDCAHESEPGCTIRAALSDGTLDATRFQSWKKLERESRWIAARQDARARSEVQARWKAITKSMRHYSKESRWR